MIYQALLLGALGSLHCAAMCGPLMLGLGTKNYGIFAFLVHHLGRWIGYMILAVLFFGLISPLAVFHAQQYVALLSGILLVLFGFKQYIKPLNRFFEWISQKISGTMLRSSYGRTGNIVLGILNGLLPCGLSFSVAILAVNTGSYLNSMSFMLLFGLGTLPVLLAISYLPKLGKNRIVQLVNSWLPKLMVILGLLLIVRSAGLGIPYISPAYNHSTDKMECCEGPH